MRPTEYLGLTPPGAPWGNRDRSLAESLLAYENSLCTGCGHPRHEAWDDLAEGEYETHEHTCQACRARELKAKDKKAEAGQYVTVDRIPGQGPRIPD